MAHDRSSGSRRHTRSTGVIHALLATGNLIYLTGFKGAIGVVEKVAFNTTHFADLMKYRFTGGPEAVEMASSNGFPMDPMMHLTPGNFLISPGLWIGLFVAAAFLAAAIRLRRYRGPL